MNKPKKCKGTGKALGVGCRLPKYIHKFGLCADCFKDWLFGTESGLSFLKSNNLRAKKQVAKDSKKEDAKKKEESRSKSYYEKQLEHEVNHIVRLIDHDKGCISCTHGWETNWTRQGQAGHRKSVKANPTLRYHLFNIFLQCSICNDILSANERNYDKGIIRVYGQEIFEISESLVAKYVELHLSIDELKEAITKARRIVKEILAGKDFTREEINQLIGIYK